MKKSELRKIIREEIKRLKEQESAYQKYFKKILSQYNVSSPAELDDKKKKEFFNKVDSGWDAEKETD